MFHSKPRAKLLGTSLLLVCLLPACGLEGSDINLNEDAGPGEDKVIPTRIMSPEPGQDDRLDALDVICESTLALSGTFTPAGTPPPNEEDCWPEGEWRIQAAIDFQGCSPQEQLTDEFLYSAAYFEAEEIVGVQFASDPMNERVSLKFTFDATGDCLGIFDHYRDDFAVISLRPIVETGTTTITGKGTFALFNEDSF